MTTPVIMVITRVCVVRTSVGQVTAMAAMARGGIVCTLASTTLDSKEREEAEETESFLPLFLFLFPAFSFSTIAAMEVTTNQPTTV